MSDLHKSIQDMSILPGAGSGQSNQSSTQSTAELIPTFYIYDAQYGYIIKGSDNETNSYHLVSRTAVPPSPNVEWNFTLYSKLPPSQGGAPKIKIFKNSMRDGWITLTSLASENPDLKWKRYLRDTSGDRNEVFEFSGELEREYIWRGTGVSNLDGDFECREKGNSKIVARLEKLKSIVGQTLRAKLFITSGYEVDHELLLSSAIALEIQSRINHRCTIS